MTYFFHFLTLGFFMFAIGFLVYGIGAVGEFLESRDPRDLYAVFGCAFSMCLCAWAVLVRLQISGFL